MSDITWVPVQEGLSFRIRGYHPLWRTLSSVLLLASTFVTPALCSNTGRQAPRPRIHNAWRLTCTRFRLFPVRSPLLRESQLLFFPGDTKMFQFSPFTSVPYVFRNRYQSFSLVGCPIRKSPDQCSLTASRSFSQSTTSFIAYRRRNIHHILLVT